MLRSTTGRERKPSLREYPLIRWDQMDLRQFNRIPGFVRPLMSHYKTGWETFHLIPVESGRGCPYGCEFCTVTGFFGDSIRFPQALARFRSVPHGTHAWQVETEVKQAWRLSYDPARTREALDSMNDQPMPYKISHLVARLFFRGIYFPHQGPWGWIRLIVQHSRVIASLCRESFSRGLKGQRSELLNFETGLRDPTGD